MKKIITVTLLFVFMIGLSANPIYAQKGTEPWSKYPGNSAKNFPDAESFYNSLDKNQYAEYQNAKMNIREN